MSEQLHLPPERDLPDPEGMLAEIIDTVAREQRRRPASRWPLAAVAGLVTVALGVGGAQLVGQRDATPAAPVSSPDPTVGAWVDAEGTAHFRGAGTARYRHFTVTVDNVATSGDARRWARRVTVCVNRLGDDARDGRAPVRATVWSLTQHGNQRDAVIDRGAVAPVFVERWLAAGECSTGWLTFAADAGQPAVLTYRNAAQGETAIWTLEP